MNYIAHALISNDFEHFMLGQLLGDFAINSVLDGRHERLIEGVRAHRALDQFTDGHFAFVQGVKLLEAGCGRYAPVVMDVFIDRVLALHWQDFCPHVPFDGFLARLYGAIEQWEVTLPERMQKPAHRMRTMDWLSGFSEDHALEQVFYYMAKRVRKPEWIRSAAETIEGRFESLEPLALEILNDPGLRKFGSDLF